MNDSPLSTRRSFFAVEANDARMPHPPTQAPPALPEDVAMQVAELARVPVGEIPLFCDAICETVQRVWETDRRAVSSRPGRALLRAAEAARTFNEAICSLNKDDREWVERLMARPEYQDLPRDFIVTVSQIDDLFSTAVGSSIPPMPGTAALREKGAGQRDLLRTGCLRFSFGIFYFSRMRMAENSRLIRTFIGAPWLTSLIFFACTSLEA